MITASIHLDGDGCWPDLKEPGSFKPGQVQGFARLTGGMVSGSSSVCIRVGLEDGTVGLVETSMSLFLAAARAFETKEQMIAEQLRTQRKDS